MHITRRTAVLSLLATSLATSLDASMHVAAARPPGRDLEARFLRAVERGELALVREYLGANPELARTRDERGRSALVLAYLARQREVADELRGTGLELDAVEAVMAKDWELVDRLLRADPMLANAAHPIGGTPLHAAALTGQIENWRLRSLGCESDARPAGGNGFTAARSAMDCAWEVGAWNAATELLSNGADVDAVQAGGDSVLHGAVRRRSERLVKLAIRKGADVTARDAKERTPKALAAELDWEAGVQLLENHAALPRDHRASRFAFDANMQPVQRVDLSDVPREKQSEVTGSSHANLGRVRELVDADPRLVWSISTDDELAIEACAHVGSREIIRYHLDHGAPLSLPTAVSVGDADFVRGLLRRDPRLVHERGAHDFPVMWYVALGGAGPEMAELLRSSGVEVDQESHGTTALHWCALRDDRDLARWLVDAGADLEAVGYKWDPDGQTPFQLARTRGRDAIASLLREAGARPLEPGASAGDGDAMDAMKMR